jgi:hypothetical protein
MCKPSKNKNRIKIEKQQRTFKTKGVKANQAQDLKYCNVIFFSSIGTSTAHVTRPSWLRESMCVVGLKLCCDSTSHRWTYFLSSKLPCQKCLVKCDCSGKVNVAVGIIISSSISICSRCNTNKRHYHHRYRLPDNTGDKGKAERQSLGRIAPPHDMCPVVITQSLRNGASAPADDSHAHVPVTAAECSLDERRAAIELCQHRERVHTGGPGKPWVPILQVCVHPIGIIHAETMLPRKCVDSVHGFVFGAKELSLFEHLQKAATFRLQKTDLIERVLHPAFAQELYIRVDPGESLHSMRITTENEAFLCWLGRMHERKQRKMSTSTLCPSLASAITHLMPMLIN